MASQNSSDMGLINAYHYLAIKYAGMTEKTHEEIFKLIYLAELRMIREWGVAITNRWLPRPKPETIPAYSPYPQHIHHPFPHLSVAAVQALDRVFYEAREKDIDEMIGKPVRTEDEVFNGMSEEWKKEYLSIRQMKKILLSSGILSDG